MAVGTKDYSVPWLADLFHSFPHVALTFQSVNSSFNPENPSYRESLVFWGAVPVLWLVVTLLLFLMYFCYRCCQRDVEKQRPVPCLRWSMAVLAIIICAAAGVCFYGNEEAHKGVHGFTTAVHKVEATVSGEKGITAVVVQLQESVNQSVHPELLSLKGLIKTQIKKRKELSDKLQEVQRYAEQVTQEVKVIWIEAVKVSLTSLWKQLQNYSFYRWIATLVILCWKVLLCLILLIGIARTSKYTLLFFSACGIFTLVLCWAMAGFHLATGVGMGDYCVEPTKYIQKVAARKFDIDAVNYYMECSGQGPYAKVLNGARESVAKANNSLTAIITEARKSKMKQETFRQLRRHVEPVRKGLKKIKQELDNLSHLVDCRIIHNFFSGGVKSLCHQALGGVALVFLGAVIAGILLSILVLLASKAWRHFGSRKGYYEVDQEDPFMPQPGNTSPSYYSFSRGHHTFPREHMAMERRGTPPPAYNGFEQHGSHTLPLNQSLEERQERPERPGPGRHTFTKESQA